ncbi:MAG: hypothetical protein A6F71_10135 [Cycloclasticus sp. symbiont of Poecilosclerida sp. M]|nr:MAG: hypothetical protein A6F71_10135 [Cycloclasticus sp. symbiont of Poecilosclerida sp. M]
MFDDVLAIPAGIINPANNCYASAIVQYLFNLSTITDMLPRNCTGFIAVIVTVLVVLIKVCNIEHITYL